MLRDTMIRFSKLSLIALAAFLMLAPMAPKAAAQRHVIVGGGFYGGYYGPGWYGPGWYGPGWYGRWGYPYYYGPAAGNVKIETKVKGNSIYVDGGYAGLTGKLKKFPLRPGNHTIEVKDHDGRTIFNQRVEVLMGKTTKVYPDPLA